MSHIPCLGNVYQTNPIRYSGAFSLMIAVEPQKTSPKIILNRIYHGLARTGTQVQISADFQEEQYIDCRDNPEAFALTKEQLQKLIDLKNLAPSDPISISKRIQEEIEETLLDQYPDLF